MKRSNVIRHQAGAALLLMAAAMIIAAATLSYQLMGGLGAKLKRQNVQEVAQALADAKENLLVFAESIPNIYDSTKSPGFLPCPDMRELSHPYSGSPGGATCAWSSSQALGRFPGSNSGTNYFFFSISQKEGGYSLWYAISDPLRYGSTAANPVYDYDTAQTSITLDNGAPLAAIIIAAGDPVGGQNGRNSTDVASAQWNQYLESISSVNLSNGKFSTLTTLPVGTPYNDRSITITLAEFQSRMKATVCSLAKSKDWCSNASNYNGSGWFKQFNWGFSCIPNPNPNSNPKNPVFLCTPKAQICSTPTADVLYNNWQNLIVPTGINVTECP